MRKIIKKIDNSKKESDFEARKNLSGFFSLLLEIDQRVSPRLYKKTKNNENNRDSNNSN